MSEPCQHNPTNLVPVETVTPARLLFKSLACETSVERPCTSLAGGKRIPGVCIQVSMAQRTPRMWQHSKCHMQLQCWYRHTKTSVTSKKQLRGVYADHLW